MSLEFLTGFTWLFNLMIFIKLFALVLVFFYFIFTLIILRQVALMNQVVETSFSPVVRAATWLQAIAVGLLFFLIFALV
jgi:hypothetical protein